MITIRRLLVPKEWRRAHSQSYILNCTFHSHRTGMQITTLIKSQIAARDQEEPDVSFEGNEETLLKEFGN